MAEPMVDFENSKDVQPSFAQQLLLAFAQLTHHLKCVTTAGLASV